MQHRKAVGEKHYEGWLRSLERLDLVPGPRDFAFLLLLHKMNSSLCLLRYCTSDWRH